MSKILKAIKEKYPEKIHPKIPELSLFVRERLDYRWRRMTSRVVDITSERHIELRKKMSEMFIALDAIGFIIIFVDEFKISQNTHANYNWCLRGTYPGLPLAGY